MSPTHMRPNRNMRKSLKFSENYFNWNIYFTSFNKTPLYFGLFAQKSRRLFLSSKVPFHSHFHLTLRSKSLNVKSLLCWIRYKKMQQSGKQCAGFTRICEKERQKKWILPNKLTGILMGNFTEIYRELQLTNSKITEKMKLVFRGQTWIPVKIIFSRCFSASAGCLTTFGGTCTGISQSEWQQLVAGYSVLI